MARIRRAIVVVVALMIAVSGSTPAAADPNHLCDTNPAYRSMHENECDLGHGGSTPDHPAPRHEGLLGRVLHGLGHLL